MAGSTRSRPIDPDLPAKERTGIPAWVYVLVVAGLLALLAIVLLAMGRVPWCKCGYVKLWHGGRGDSEISQHLADRYTYSHILHGVIFYFLLWLIFRGRLSVAARLVIATLIEGAWEIFENTPFIINRYRTQTISRDYYGDTAINVIGDIAAMVVGFLIAARLPAWVTVVLLVATELVLLYLIRDNLLLNIIMLIYPLEWIKQWQAGG
jgi:Protein of unknown function (DUF2585)